MNSSFLSITSKEVINSILITVVVAVLGTLQQMVTQYGFHFNLYDWALIAQIAVTSGLGVIVANLGTTKEGKFAGIVKVK